VTVGQTYSVRFRCFERRWRFVMREEFLYFFLFVVVVWEYVAFRLRSEWLFGETAIVWLILSFYELVL